MLVMKCLLFGDLCIFFYSPITQSRLFLKKDNSRALSLSSSHGSIGDAQAY